MTVSPAYRPPHHKDRRRILLQLVAVAGLAFGANVALSNRPAVALDAPCGPGNAYVRMWELPGFEGDSVVLCSNKTNFALVGNNGRFCDSAGESTGFDRYTWKNCPSSLYVYGHNACFYTYIGYTENTLKVYANPGPTQVTLSGIWNNNLESFRWC